SWGQGYHLSSCPNFRGHLFRIIREGLDRAATDDLNRAAIRAIQVDGRAFVTGTLWHGHAAIRAAFDNWQTTLQDVHILQFAVTHVASLL
ncbi:MAG: hypothetical protein NFV56_09670, partial [Candidatus Accumulibacter sp.]|nr:hypothetical protein [Accumulibacter sp.]